MKIEYLEGDSEGDAKRADDALVSGKLEGVKALFVSGISISGKLNTYPRKCL
jgi:hypothetical protein